MWLDIRRTLLVQPWKNGASRASKKIEQEASGECQKSEYLTLLNTFENAKTRDRQGPSEPYLEIVDTHLSDN